MRFLAPSACLLLLAAAAGAASRPHYGGVLRLETRTAATDDDSPTRALVFENLTSLEDSNQPQPKLATTWDSQNGSRRWQFWLRRGVRFHDGTPLTAAAVVASFTAGQCGPPITPGMRSGTSCPWSSVRAVGDSVVFEFADPRPQFAAEVALPRYAIARARPNELAAGTGPFRQGEARGGVVTFQANDDYWGGRPFIDAIEVLESRSPRDQIVDLDLGRADVIEVGPEQLRRITKARTAVSQATDLISLSVRTGRVALQDLRLRQAIALSVDRGAIHNVVLQRQGEVAGGLLPNWISGYAFLLPQSRDLVRAQQLVRATGNAPALTIAAAEPDPVLQLIAERIALNAREAGLTIQPTAAKENADLVVMHVGLRSIDPGVEFADMCDRLGRTRRDPAPHSPQALYEEERSLVAQAYVIPLVYVPRAYGLAPRVRNWAMTPDGRLRLADVWLSPGEGAR